MRILSINIFYGYGSTGKIIEDIHARLLRDGHESYVAYGLRQATNDDGVHFYKIVSDFLAIQYGRIARIIGLRYCCAYLETYRLLKYIKKIHPEIVHIHCMNCSYVNPYILLKYLARKKYKVLVTHHADVTITANCDHSYDCNRWMTGCGNCPDVKSAVHSIFFDNTAWSWKMMNRAFSKFSRFYVSSVSEWMGNRVRMSPFNKKAVFKIIENGIDTGSFQYEEKSAAQLRSELNLGNKPVIMHATPSFTSAIKGGKYVLELAKRLPDVTFLIVGIKEDIDNIPDNVRLVKYVENKARLATYYSCANLTLLTSRRESFSLVTAESLCCGTPVVGFKAGAPEMIAIPEYSQFVEYGDMDALQCAVENGLHNTPDKQEISDKARIKYSEERMYKQYLDFYKTILLDVDE